MLSFFLVWHCLNRWSRGEEEETGATSSKALATELAADEPPAAHPRATEEALATDTADESCADGEARSMNAVDVLCVADKAPSGGSARELCAADMTCGIPIGPPCAAAEAQQKPLSNSRTMEKEGWFTWFVVIAAGSCRGAKLCARATSWF
ncbi:uncharacterized protein [Triticum aestivum]|uniref:uncharacterized protein n=1 Tax=Triticum aestivum TaxID=4565 RepID=UPI001D00E9D9|nr:uncharacterized protein LOC123129404 [Triticum aestivum]